MRLSFALSPLHRMPGFVVGAVLLVATARAYAAQPVAVLLPDEQTILQMEQRAAQASVRDQCFLYTELAHIVTEMAGHQMLVGDTEQASASLKRVGRYAELIHLGLANDTKRLKNAEMLMHQTTFHLSGYLRATSGEDRETLQAALKQLNKVEDELMTQVFKH